MLRSRAVQSLLAWLVAGYIELLITTVRWRFENRANADLAMASPEGLIALFWHGRIAQGMACRPLLAEKPRRVMISLSRDGEFIALAAERLRIPPIRGSAGRGEATLAKGGASAFRQALAFLESGGVMVLTPDGPRGPREILPSGPVQMARAAGCPTFLMSLAARPALALKSWDGARIPLPFARGQVVLEGPLGVAADADEDALEAARADWQRKMRAGQARAEALLDGRAA
ncbi:MAG: lysophospholipid acyltransferase family protein [Caulobacteraceae bacterium]